MTWIAVARKDFQDAIRSRVLISLSVFFVVLLGGVSGVFAYVLEDPGRISSQRLFGLFGRAGGSVQFSFVGFLGFLLGFIALITAYASIVGEQESGTLKILLSLPHSRRDVILGKLAGRSTVVAVPALAGFVVSMLVLVGFGVTVDFETLVPQVFLTLLFAVVFVAIAVGISAASETNRQTTLTAVGLYVLFSLFWASLTSAVPRSSSWILEQLGRDPLSFETSIKIALAIKWFNPMRAYEALAASLYADSLVSARSLVVNSNQKILLCQLADGQARRTLRQGVTCQNPTGTLPLYFSDAAMGAVLVFWLVAPLVYGYYVFEGRDL